MAVIPRRLSRLLLIAIIFFVFLYTLTPVRTPRYLPDGGALTELLSHKFDLAKLSPIGSVEKLRGTLPGGHSRGGKQQLPIEKELKGIDDVQTYVENLLVSSFHPPYMLNGRRMPYDPNRWQDFERETGYETQRVRPKKDQSAPYLPYPEYNTDAWKEQWEGNYIPCQGARGLMLPDSPADQMRAYRTLPLGFPRPVVGSSEAVGLKTDVCFDLSRYDPYGLSIEQKHLRPGDSMQEPNWDEVVWGKLQDECMLRNAERYSPHARVTADLFIAPKPLDEPEPEHLPRFAPSGKKYTPRTAVCIRTWEGYRYTHNDIRVIRAMVTELALFTGGEYSIFLLVNVKSAGADLYTDNKVYERIIMSVPQELRSIAVLWTEDVCAAAYPKVGNWDVYWHQWMPIQWFAKTHPEYDYFWNWEMDARLTGHHYEFLQKMVEFSLKQPRKMLWERNKRYYLPSVHGTFEEFCKDTNEKTAAAAKDKLIPGPIWGPEPFSAEQDPIGPKPPPVTDDDWGVGEEADLITLLPPFDPRYTDWPMRHKIWNFVPGVVPHFTQQFPKDPFFMHPGFIHINRRVFINTVSRLSRKQLEAMHVENVAGRTMASEMWPVTAALHHGLKVVTAPHPIWFNRKWPALYTDIVFNSHSNNDSYWGHDLPNFVDDEKYHHRPGHHNAAEKREEEGALHKRQRPPDPILEEDPEITRLQNDGPVRFPAQWSERKDSVYNPDRESNFKGWSFYYHAEFPDTLYRRWMGWLAQSGPGQEPGRDQWTGSELSVSPDSQAGRICLPTMLLHPVKSVRRQEEPDVKY